jgi:predicted dehydrogenase
MTEIRIGVIGVGGRGKLAQLWNNPEYNARVVAGADVSAAQLRAFREHYQGDVFVTDDYCRLLERDDIDAVGVFSPDFCHEQHAIAVLQAGKHLFCEKPLAISVEGCDNILRAWKRSGGKKFLMGFNMRYMYFIRTMKQIIDEGTIGQLRAVWVRHFVPSGGDYYFHDWHATRQNANTLLLQKASHDIDVVHWLAGGYGKRVVGMGGRYHFGGEKPNDLTCPSCDERHSCIEVQKPDNPRQLCAFRQEIDIEDVNHILWELDNGVQCSYMQCHFAANNRKARNYVFIGTEGMVENFWDGQTNAIEVTTRRSGKWKDYANRVYTTKTPPGGHSGADPIIAAEFLQMVRGDDVVPTATPIDGRQSVAVGCAGAHSLRHGSIPVDVPPLPAW